MRVEDLLKHFPYLYHMAEADTWSSIQQHGLLSTTALLDKFAIEGDQRLRIESHHRPKCITISHLSLGAAVIRDQKPMNDAALRKCLQGMATQEWYETLNRKVFFWLNWERLRRLLSARAYRKRRHAVLTLDTSRMVQRHRSRITLSPINSGATLFKPQPRGLQTFLPIENYAFEKWVKKRGDRGHALVELAVDYGVTDIRDIVVRVEHRRGDEPPTRVWP
jgi:hypothetical protein